MFNVIIEHFAYPKAMLLMSTALFILGWLGYFVRCLFTQGGKTLTTLYYPYLLYSFFIMLWISSNAYFQSGWLVEFGASGAILMAKLANVFSYMAFTFAFYFSCRLTSNKPNNRIKLWQSSLMVVVTLFALYVNIIPGHTVRDVTVNAPSDFVIEFGPATPLFFSTLILFTSLTLFNLLGLSRSGDHLKRLKSTYMVIGIIIFMLSTATIHLFVTMVFNDFSFAWLPPALAISEILLMGYAVLCNRFYSWRYLSHLGISFAFTALVYALPMLWLHDWLLFSSHLLASTLWCLLCGLTWKKTWRLCRQCTSLILYGEKSTPVDKIHALVEDFQSSSQQGMSKLATLLNIEQEQTMLVSDATSNELYTTYLAQNDPVLLIEEVEHHLSYSGDQGLDKLREQMTNSKAALILPLFNSQNTLSHLLISPQKHDGSLFANEEISALQRLLKKVQSYIHCERKVKQSQALAKSIAHEMRNPLAQIQLHLEKLDSMVSRSNLSSSLRGEIDKGKDAIYRGGQLIEIILREAEQSSPSSNSLQHYSMVELIESAIESFAYACDQKMARIHFEQQDDFIANVNDTLFGFIVFNLLRNAIHYFDEYPDSRVEIRLEKSNHYNTVYFKDYGPGIEPQIVQRIFDDFFSYQKRGGSGLGLSYCKRVMQVFGGSAKCQSVYGQYTEFSLQFPLVETSQTEQIQTPHRINCGMSPLSAQPKTEFMAPHLNHSDINVLVTDDNPSQRALVKLYLEKLGANVTEAENGQEALDVVLTQPIDIIFMDVQMPIMNGFDATKAIKLHFAELPVIALSGESGEQEVAMITSIMDGRLVKPTTQLILSQTINKWVAAKPEPENTQLNTPPRLNNAFA